MSIIIKDLGPILRNSGTPYKRVGNSGSLYERLHRAQHSKTTCLSTSNMFIVGMYKRDDY
jgi:hypothetical protein